MSRADILDGLSPKQKRYVLTLVEARRRCSIEIDEAIRRMNETEEAAEQELSRSESTASRMAV